MTWWESIGGRMEVIDEWVIAIQAAEVLCQKFQEDVAILYDFSVVRLSENEEPPLEIIRYDGPR